MSEVRQGTLKVHSMYKEGYCKYSNLRPGDVFYWMATGSSPHLRIIGGWVDLSTFEVAYDPEDYKGDTPVRLHIAELTILAPWNP